MKWLLKHHVAAATALCVAGTIAVGALIGPYTALGFALGWPVGMLQGIAHRMAREAEASLQRWPNQYQ